MALSHDDIQTIAALLDSRLKPLEAQMATKDDIKNMATKDDLKNFATKDDLKNFATKDDIKNLVTKDELRTSENLILSEVSRVHTIMLKYNEALTNDIIDIKRTLALAGNDNRTFKFIN